MASTTTKAKTARNAPRPAKGRGDGETSEDETSDETSDPTSDETSEGEAEASGDALPAEDEVAADEVAVLPPEPRLDTDIHETRLSSLRSPVDRFLSEARSFPRLSEDEERQLGLRVRQRGDLGAARKLVVHNLRLVVAIAYQYRRAWANILDLFQEGSLGLMEAVKRWEPTLGPRFGSYAAYWIRAFVLKFLMTNSRLINVGNTRAGRKLFFRLEKERQKLLAAGFEPTPKLLAAKLDVDEKDLAEVGRVLDSREVSFEPRPGAGSGGEEGYPLSERIAADQVTPEERAAEAEMVGAVAAFIGTFASHLTDPREIAVWREHLAATDDPVPLGVLGERFGVTKQRMGQIADKLKKRFREEIVRDLGDNVRTDWLGDVE